MSPSCITLFFLSLLFNTNIPLCNLFPILSLVGTTTHFLPFPGSEISTSILPFSLLIFSSFTSFCQDLPNNNQYSTDHTTNACAYIFTLFTSNSKYSIHPYISFFPLFAVCIVNFCFLFTSNPSSSHRSSQMITISKPLSSSPSSQHCPITTTSTSWRDVANSTGLSSEATSIAPTAGGLFYVYIWSTTSLYRFPLIVNRSQTLMFKTSISKMHCNSCCSALEFAIHGSQWYTG